MFFEKSVRPLIAAILLLSALSRGNVPPEARQMVNDMQMRQQLAFLGNYGSGSDGYLAPVRAYVEVFGKGAVLSGFGKVVVRIKASKCEVGYRPGYGQPHPRSESIRPDFSYVELDEGRYFPEDTDSIKVWGIKGLPVGKTHWAFLLIKGKFNAYAHFPGNGAQYFTRGGGTDQSLPDSAACFGADSLRHQLRSLPRAWVESGKDPLFAASIFNSASEQEFAKGTLDEWNYSRIIKLWGKGGSAKSKVTDSATRYPSNYLLQVASARDLCDKKRFPEADERIAAAARLDSSYYGLYWARAYCLEAAGSSREALSFYRKAAQFSPLDGNLRKELRGKLDALEKKIPEPAAYRSMEKLPKPEMRILPDPVFPYSR